MIAAEKEIFARLMIANAELYGKKLSTQLLGIYWHSLKNYPLVEIRQALEAHVINSEIGQFMPKPADIVRFIAGETHIQALQAWTKVMSAIKTIGAYSSVVFDDALIHIVLMEIGGWVVLCRMSEEQLHFRGHEFCKRYTAYLRRPSPRHPKKLLGIVEQQNQGGCFIAEPKIIGDKQLAMSVYTQGQDYFTAHSVHDLESALEDYHPGLKLKGNTDESN